jgi:hypothetical protein
VVSGTTTAAWFTEGGKYPDVPGTVLVSVYDEPTPLDRFLAWYRRR